MKGQLDDSFLIELIKSCVLSGDFIAVISPHLKYNYLPSEPYKKIFQYIFDFYGANKKPPTIGVIAQNVRDDLNLLAQVRECDVYDSKDQILKSFEKFIKDSRFFNLHNEVTDIYHKGDKDEAIEKMATESQEIHQFSLQSKLPLRVYRGFDERQRERFLKDRSIRKIPTGIPQFDYHTRGGFDRGTGILAIGRSGKGKTTFLRSLGFHASFRGIPVLHIASGDSTVEEVLDGYDAMWSEVDINNMREGAFTPEDLKRIAKLKQQYQAECGEILVHVYKQFNQASLGDVRNLLKEVKKEYDIGLLILDYLEKFEPGDGRRYSQTDDSSRLKKLATAEKIINIATEFDIGVATVTQANDISAEIYNDPKKVLTRSNISNLKATIDPFAYCITLNQTDDENDKEIMRIHEEKLRHYKTFSWSSTYSIKQHRDTGRFIDVGETKRLFWDDERKRIINNTPSA